MSIAMLVQDAIKTASVCLARHPGAGLSKSEWIAGGVTASLEHSIRHGHPNRAAEYVDALNAAGQSEAAAIVSGWFEASAPAARQHPPGDSNG